MPTYKYLTNNRDKLLDRKAFTDHPFSAKLTSNGAYIVYSYDEPIAVCLMNKWFISRQRYSNLTTAHMHFVRNTLNEEELPVRLSTPTQFADVLSAANAT